MQNLQKFHQLYNDVFDKDNNIIACGRERCKQLILLCEKLDSTIDFGNASTGFMKPENIINLKKKLGE